MCDCQASQINRCMICGTDRDTYLYPLLASSENGSLVAGFTYNVFVCVECSTERGAPRGALKHSNGEVYIRNNKCKDSAKRDCSPLFNYPGR